MASENFGTFINAVSSEALTGAELVPVVVSSVTKSATVNALKTFIGSSMGGFSGPVPYLDEGGQHEDMIVPMLGPIDIVGILSGLGGLTGFI